MSDAKMRFYSLIQVRLKLVKCIRTISQIHSTEALLRSQPMIIELLPSSSLQFLWRISRSATKKCAGKGTQRSSPIPGSHNLHKHALFFPTCTSPMLTWGWLAEEVGRSPQPPTKKALLVRPGGRAGREWEPRGGRTDERKCQRLEKKSSGKSMCVGGPWREGGIPWGITPFR